jgi:hypothetical protein
MVKHEMDAMNSNPTQSCMLLYFLGQGVGPHFLEQGTKVCLLLLLGRVLSTHWTESVLGGHSVMSEVRGGVLLLLLGLLYLGTLWPVQGALLVSRYDATTKVNLLILSFHIIILCVHLKMTSMSKAPFALLHCFIGFYCNLLFCYLFS